MNKVLLGALLAVTLLVSACSQGPAAVQGELEAQFGSPRDDDATVVTTDAARGRVYVAGKHAGPYDESGAAATGDVVFFRRHNRDGSLAWKVNANAAAPGVTAFVFGADTDRAGNVYFAWRLAAVGAADRGFVSKYSPGGRLLLRTELPGAYQVAVATDALDNVYLATSPLTSTGKVEKFSSRGQRLWTKTLRSDAPGSSVRPAGLDLAPDGSVYVAANVSGQPLLLKLRGSDGQVLKTVDVAGDTARQVRVGGGLVYVYSVLNTPFHFEPKVSSFRPDGSRVWERRGAFESDETDSNLSYDAATGGISADARGNVYLTGAFTVDGAGADDFDTDVLVRKYTPAGTVAYNRRFTDLAAEASGRGIAAMSEGELYVVGTTGGEVNGKNSGGIDAFLLRLNAQGQKVWER